MDASAPQLDKLTANIVKPAEDIVDVAPVQEQEEEGSRVSEEDDTSMAEGDGVEVEGEENLSSPSESEGCEFISDDLFSYGQLSDDNSEYHSSGFGGSELSFPFFEDLSDDSDYDAEAVEAFQEAVMGAGGVENVVPDVEPVNVDQQDVFYFEDEVQEVVIDR